MKRILCWLLLAVPAHGQIRQGMITRGNTIPIMSNGGLGTSGSVLFLGSGGIFSQNNSNFFWDDTNKWLGLGTSVPSVQLHVVGTAAGTRPLQVLSPVDGSGASGVLVGELSIWRQVYNATNSSMLDLLAFSTATTQPAFRIVNHYEGTGSQGDIRLGYLTSSTVYTDVLTITTNTRVGIGTTSPTGPLDVSGGISAGTYGGVNAPPANGFIVSGNVGLGTSAPASGARLALVGRATLGTNTAPVSAADIFNVSGDSVTLRVSSTTSALFMVTAAGTVGIGTTVPAASVGLTIAGPFNGSKVGLAINVPSGDSGYINFNADSAFLVGYDQPNDVFAIRESGTDRLVVKGSGSGNVGIATTSPNASLDVFNVSGDSVTLRVSSGTTRLMELDTTGSPIFGTALSVANGGTGATTLTLNGLLYGNGTSSVLATSQGGANCVWIANSGAPSCTNTPTLTGTNITGVPAASINAGTLGSSVIASSVAASVIVNSNLASGSFTNITGVGTLTAGTWNATAITAANGGTGATTLTSNGVLYGNGTGVVQATAQGGANTVLTANAGAPSFSATPTITGLTISAAGGNALSVTSSLLTGGSRPFPLSALADLQTSTPTATGLIRQGSFTPFDLWVATGTTNTGSWQNMRTAAGP